MRARETPPADLWAMRSPSAGLRSGRGKTTRTVNCQRDYYWKGGLLLCTFMNIQPSLSTYLIFSRYHWTLALRVSRRLLCEMAALTRVCHVSHDEQIYRLTYLFLDQKQRRTSYANGSP